MKIQRCDANDEIDECAQGYEIDEFINDLIIITYNVKNETLVSNIQNE